MEANGDVYACDRYAFPSYCLGNVMETDLGILMERNRHFGMHKAYGLSEECFDCPYIKLCFGGCPKDRFTDGRNYLCEGYKIFFAAILNDIARKGGGGRGSPPNRTGGKNLSEGSGELLW